MEVAHQAALAFKRVFSWGDRGFESPLLQRESGANSTLWGGQASERRRRPRAPARKRQNSQTGGLSVPAEEFSSSRPKWGPARAKAAPGCVAAGAPGTGRACLRDRPPRDGGVPRRPHQRGSSRRYAAGCCPFPTGRRAAPGPPEPGGMQRPHQVYRVDARRRANGGMQSRPRDRVSCFGLLLIPTG
jgi:hypothetical protein